MNEANKLMWDGIENLNSAMIESSMEMGSDPNFKKNEQYPLEFLLEKYDDETKILTIVELLLSAGAATAYKMAYFKEQPIHQIANKNFVNCAKLFQKYGADFYRKKKNILGLGKYPYQIALDNNFSELAEILKV